MLGHIWNYVSNNALVAALLAPLIIAMVGTLWLAVKQPAGTWFWSAANVSHGGLTLLVLVLLTALAVIIALVRALRRERASSRLAAAPVFERGNYVRPMQPTPQVTPEAEPKVTEGFEPNRVQLIAAMVLIDRYPRRLQLHDLAVAMKQLAGGVLPVPVAPQGEIARWMEDMERHGVAVIKDPDSQMAYYGLTRHGRDFMLEKWKATARKPAAAVEPAPGKSALRALEDDDKKS